MLQGIFDYIYNIIIISKIDSMQLEMKVSPLFAVLWPDLTLQTLA